MVAATHAASRRRAFTLVEMIAVMVVVSVVAAVAIPSFSSIAGTRQIAAARLLLRDLTYARERAIATGTRVWVVFSVSGNSYSVLAENPAAPGRAGAAIIPDPSAPNRTYQQLLNTGEFSGVQIVSAAFDSQVEVGFDWCGRPLNTTSAFLAANGVVTLTGSKTVTVQARTGLCTMP
ncbi:MAG: GspH/FimT family pseudopilin [Phycisphaeraceae bacterium]|nr:GspH/FimT family pseudopilin [Phycisphaeraceae bacterium]